MQETARGGCGSEQDFDTGRTASPHPVFRAVANRFPLEICISQKRLTEAVGKNADMFLSEFLGFLPGVLPGA
jgi:hypothetical protein